MKNKIDMSLRPMIRLFSPSCKRSFSADLENIDWCSLFESCSNANTCYDVFIYHITELFNKHFPLVRVSRKAYKNKEWFSASLRNSLNKKNYYYKQWLLSKGYSDHAKYIEYKKLYQKSCKAAKVAYYNNILNTKMNSIKSVWSNLNNIISSKTRSNSNTISSLTVNNCEFDKPNDIANIFNDYFCSVGPKLAEAIPTCNYSYSDYMQYSVTNSIYIDTVTNYELEKLIDGLKNGKACGDDGIGAQLIKENKQFLLHPLTYIFNLSLTTGIVPDKLKIAKVIPLFKSGEANSPSNYRPISLLSIFNKLLEKIIYKRLYSFFQKENILYKYQFGFREKHGTCLAVLETMDMCYKNLDNNKYVIGLFLDLKKAFDTVNHEILLHKLYNYGIRGVMYDWLKSYLNDRYQFTFVNGTRSDTKKVACGVPQGSVIGPLLFLVYINDIYKAIPEDIPKLFADDTNIFIIGDSLPEIELKANICLKNVYNWFCANKLTLNVDKSCYLLFTPKKTVINSALNIYIENQNLLKSSTCKYLGIIIDENLSWINHIDFVYNKLVKFSCIFYKIRDLLPVQCLKMLYYSFIHCHLLYGIEVYGNTVKKN